MFEVGDIVLAVNPKFAFENYEGTVMQILADGISVKWVYDPNGDELEYSPEEIKHIS